MAKKYLTREPRIHNGEKTVSSTNGAGRIRCKRMKLSPYFFKSEIYYYYYFWLHRAACGIPDQKLNPGHLQ